LHVIGDGLYVFQQRQVFGNLIGLEGPAQSHVSALVRWYPGNHFAFDLDPAATRLDEAREHIQERGLAGTVRADQTDDGAREFHGESIDGFDATELHHEVIDFYHGRSDQR